jgi:hypothetical protein
MKEAELRENSHCALCKKPIGNSGVPLFWRVTVERFGLNMPALQHQQGLGLMLGGALAQVMGADEDLALPVMDAVKVTVCESCCTRTTCVAALGDIE